MRRWLVVGGSAALGLGLGLGVILSLRRSTPFGIDTAWMGTVLDLRTTWPDWPALVMNFLGGGWFGVYALPIAVTVAFLVKRRPWTAVTFLLASAVSAGLVRVLKSLVDRTRPEDILVATDAGAYPSGHVANAATIAVVLALVFARMWVWFAGAAYTVLMALSRTFLGAHWLSDTIGGALLGAALAVLVWAPLAERIRAESGARPPATG